MRFPPLPAHVVRKWAPAVEATGVGERIGRDFMREFLARHGNIAAMNFAPHQGSMVRLWKDVREEALVRLLKTSLPPSLWTRNQPTPYHLHMILWAYSPEPMRLTGLRPR